MEIQRFVFNCLFQVAVFIMFFRYVALSVVKTLQSMARKICVNVQQELNVFREFREDRNSPVWDKGRLFESFMKGEDYIVCAQSKRKNSLFPPPVKTWKGFSVSADPLNQERFLELNVFLGSQLSTYLKTRSEQESRDRTQPVSCEKDFRQQETKDSAMGDGKKSRAVNGKKVRCEVKVTKITPLSEIMAVMARVKKKKKTSRFKTSTFANKAMKRNNSDVDDSFGEKESVNPTVKRRRYAKVVERKNTKMSEGWSQPRKDSRRHTEKAFKNKRQDSDSNNARNKQSSEAEIRPLSPFPGHSKKRKANQKEAGNIKKMMNDKLPLPVASVNQPVTEESMDYKEELLSASASITELVSLMEKLFISKSESTEPADHVVGPHEQELPVVKACYVSDYPQDNDDESDDAEYNLSPELKSLPEQAADHVVGPYEQELLFAEACHVSDYPDPDNTDGSDNAEYHLFAELKSLPEQAADHVVGLYEQELAFAEGCHVSDYPDSDNGDESDDAEYHLFAELKSLSEQAADHVVEPYEQELPFAEACYVSDYLDSDNGDESDDAEYDLFPELKSLPEQVLMLMSMLQ